MKIFVTGATGFVGSAVVPELIGAGHQVVGLVRSEEGAKKLAATGAEVHRGELTDLNSLRTGAEKVDAVIHTAFIHDFSKYLESCEIDRRAIETMGEVLKGSKRPLLVTSGMAHLAKGRAGTEDDAAPDPKGFPRVSEFAANQLLQEGVQTATVRLAPTVHGAGDHGFVPMLIAIAHKTGVSAYLQEGENPWSAVHRLDAAVVYRLAIEKLQAGGRYHAVAEESIPYVKIAEAIGRGLNVPVKSLTNEEAKEHFGWMAMFIGLNFAASSKKTRDELGWQPRQPELIADLENAGYFVS